ncbi:cupredoxin domain-containing protein [Paenibacillus macquariensis]|uniref:Cytochrome c oxidase subunit 2 n=1 Tax=Paenibacillus macquariensis TaxID=948756 RepID=A0ABY1JSK3_9BACL|nr:cupredoxin domain-containing protein [Paenibacillus macquariensis]MEC0092933.1 cupredoxin domain-containing protein [Paenibacillus macquariensis]OAB36298.1 cytochrome C oxidase subunit II [Paenibacillus macquariensis subsp. macquariensis]SIQ69047.1 cytochrome c oxidase subunit 2 [Paenibacillus macquariensis]
MKKVLVLIISCMLIMTLSACGGDNSSANSSNSGVSDTGVAPSEEIVIKASNYTFDQKEYHIKKGETVKIVFENVSGNHGVLIPGLEIQLDKKHPSKVITADKPGEYEIMCSVFCGAGHSGMISKIIVE